MASLLANSYLGIARLCYLREEYDNAFHLLAKSEALFLQKLGANSYFMAKYEDLCQDRYIYYILKLGIAFIIPMEIFILRRTIGQQREHVMKLA